MNIRQHNSLLKVGVAMQNMTTANWRQLLRQTSFAILTHLVKGVLVVTIGAVTYALVDQTTWSVISIPLALVSMVASVKFFYFSATTGTTLTAGQTVASVQQHFSDDEGWYGWHGIGMDDDLIKNDDD